jgi:hypothetical protein
MQLSEQIFSRFVWSFFFTLLSRDYPPQLDRSSTIILISQQP